MERQRLQARQYLFDPATALDKALELPPILQKKSFKQKSVVEKKKQLTTSLPSLQPKKQYETKSSFQTQIVSPKTERPLLNPNKARQSMEVQTDTFLEPLPYPLETNHIDTQTDEFLPRPPSPLFIPKSSGTDIETQIEQGDLFDFDREIEPLLQTIVGQCIENAWLESTQEMELSKFQKRMQSFEEKRASEIAEILRLEEHEKRRQAEKMRLLHEQQQKRQQKHEQEIMEFIKNLAKNTIKQLELDAFGVLENHGYFDVKAIEEMEQSMDDYFDMEVARELEKLTEARSVLDECIKQALLLTE